MKHLVIGLGEVGTALQAILDCDSYDIVASPEDDRRGPYDILDICIPYSDSFHEIVAAYKLHYRPEHTVIHSTVPVGTSDALNAHHSPVRGKHPDLKPSLLTFVKFIGGSNAGELALEYEKYGFKMRAVKDARTTEALKLWETTRFADSIVLEKEIYEYCQRNNLDFDLVYTEAIKTYNDGYEEMGLPRFASPIIEHQDGPIGGHCVIPNCHLLQSPTAKRIINFNDKL